MAFTKKTWLDRISEFPTRRILTKEDSTTETVTVTRSEGTVSQDGDAFSASNMNNLEQRIYDAFPVAVSGTLAKGASSITLSNSRITTDSMIRVYTSIYGVNPLTMTVSTGSCKLTFLGQSTAMTVAIEVV